MQDDHAGLLSRRRLLETGAVAAASLTLLDSSAFASVQRLGATPKTTDPAPLSYTRKGYRRSRFAPHVGTTVKLRPHGAAAVRAQLAAVEDVAHVKGLAGASDAYVLRFRGPSSQPLAEGIVGVRHRDFGTLQLYITPTAPDGPNQDYLAAINRRIPRRERSAAARRR